MAKSKRNSKPKLDFYTSLGLEPPKEVSPTKAALSTPTEREVENRPPPPVDPNPVRGLVMLTTETICRCGRTYRAPAATGPMALRTKPPRATATQDKNAPAQARHLSLATNAEVQTARKYGLPCTEETWPQQVSACEGCFNQRRY